MSVEWLSCQSGSTVCKYSSHICRYVYVLIDCACVLRVQMLQFLFTVLPLFLQNPSHSLLRLHCTSIHHFDTEGEEMTLFHIQMKHWALNKRKLFDSSLSSLALMFLWENNVLQSCTSPAYLLSVTVLKKLLDFFLLFLLGCHVVVFNVHT